MNSEESNGKKVEMNLEEMELVADGACGVDLERDMSSDEDNIQVILNTPALKVKESIASEIFSRKVFIGGLPTMTEDELCSVFSRFGPVKIELPYKHVSSSKITPGFAFLVFEEEKSVQRLVEFSVNDEFGILIYLASKDNDRRACRLTPWRLSDANFVWNSGASFNKRKTVFLGGLPKTITAEKVALTMTRLFDNVDFVTINTDEEFKYPKGYGYVGFSTESSYKAALTAKYITMNTCYVDKKVEIKPFMFDKQERYTSHTPVSKEQKRGPRAVQYRKF